MHSYSTDNKFKKHEKLYNEPDYCYSDMPSEYSNTLEYNHREKSLKVSFIIYIDLECLLEIILPCINNPKKSYTERKAKLKPSGWAMTLKCSFDATKNKYDYYKERDVLKSCVKI